MILDFNDAPAIADKPSVPEWATQDQYSRDDVLSGLLRQIEGVLGYLYPNGFSDPQGRKFYVGNVNGDPGESLSVELSGPKAGLWHDFATGDGGDIFDLWKAARGLASFREVLKDAAEYSGATVNTPRRTPKRKAPKGGEAWGVPSATYRYQDTTGKLIAEVERYDWETDGKRHKTFRPWDVATRTYRAPETRPLYNLPNIASAPEIIVVEGEKSADALIAQNIDATTAMGGSNTPIEKTDWSILKGRKVVIWPDNDATGRAYAERLKPYLEAEGALAVSILNVPRHRPEKWDAADAAEDGEDLGAIIRAMRSQAAQDNGRVSQFFIASDLAGIMPPAREWHIKGLIPAHTVTMLGGDGGVGKSLLALQLAVATAAGVPWISHDPAPTKSIYLSAEDDRDEIHRRLADIATGTGADMASLDNLILRSLAGEDALLAIADSRNGTLQPTPFYHELDDYIATSGAGFLVLDTLADLHSGQENDRAVARQFISLLRGLAIRRECTILLLAHPSLTGMSSGSGLSGSTAWNNSVRSRLYFERITEDGFEADTDLRRMSTKKANYGKKGDETIVRWKDGLFVPEGNRNEADAMSSSVKARRVFMSLLEKAIHEGRNVNGNGGPYYAPKVFADDPRNERVSRSAFQQAMADLFACSAIKVETFGPPSRKVTRIVPNEN
jgi:RecA-family ATPase/5S rRNA maturation endonuclease (ribonuclease M5)